MNFKPLVILTILKSYNWMPFDLNLLKWRRCCLGCGNLLKRSNNSPVHGIIFRDSSLLRNFRAFKKAGAKTMVMTLWSVFILLGRVCDVGLGWLL